jgi:hypothetical protein
MIIILTTIKFKLETTQKKNLLEGNYFLINVVVGLYLHV